MFYWCAIIWSSISAINYMNRVNHVKLEYVVFKEKKLSLSKQDPKENVSTNIQRRKKL